MNIKISNVFYNNSYITVAYYSVIISNLDNGYHWFSSIM
jgi:hypothetical protein